MTVVVVGDAGLDVVARHAGPIAYGSDTPAAVSVTMGGAGANTAAWLAWCGSDVLLATRVGDDPAGPQVVTALADAGVRTAATVDRDRATCCVVVLVDGGAERTMLADRGACAALSASEVPLDGAQHLHLSGYVLLDPRSREAGVEVLAAARAAGLTTSVDPQAAAMIDSPGQFLEWVRSVDLVLPNSDEFAALPGLSDHVRAVAVTDGPRPVRWLESGREVSVPVPAVECVDPTGAGDAFNAGLLTAWLAGAPPEDALHAGAVAGSTAVGHVGARPRGVSRR